MPTISVIIRAYNEERHIGRLLDGIERQVLPAGLHVEVILVDSGSTDSTVAIAVHMGAKVITINKDEFSFGRALNFGCAAARGDILLFASAHVYPVYTDWIMRMLAPFNTPEVALVYGRQIGNEQTRFSEHEVFARWFPAQSNYHQTSPFCNNANCAIRKSLWQSQPFDETLTGLEDMDWASRVLERKFYLVYEAEAHIVHVHEETAAKIKTRYQREALAMRHIVPHVHVGFIDFLLLFVQNVLSDSRHALKEGVWWREFRWIVIFRWMQFYGTYLGHRQKGMVTQELVSRFYYPNAPGAQRMKHNKQDQDTRKIQYS